MVYVVCRWLYALILKVFFRLRVCGRENIPNKGGFIIASNHVSFLDPVAIGVASPRKLNYMARHDLFSSPFISWLLFQYHVFPVQRNTADLSALKEAMKRVRAGKGLLLFPEGRRQEAGAAPVEPQAGIGFLAAKLDVPVIPVYVSGTEKAFPRGTKFMRPHKICVYFGRQISIERSLPYQDIARQIMAHIRHLSC